MYCKNCGKEIDDNAYVCVHCGVLVNGSKPSTNVVKEKNTIALVGFILSFFTSIIGLILSIIGYKKADSEYGGDRKGLALAGIIISAVSIGLAIIIGIAYGSMLGAALA